LIKVRFADDHSIVRAGLRRNVEESGDMQVVAEADDGRVANGLVKKLGLRNNAVLSRFAMQNQLIEP
jgi:YesN/AraC family two-component response regulator